MNQVNRFFIILSHVFVCNEGKSLRVIGGTDISPGMYPYVVRLEIRLIIDIEKDISINQHICTCTALTPVATLTAAHCILALPDVIASMKEEPMLTNANIQRVIRYGSVKNNPMEPYTFSVILSTLVHPNSKILKLTSLRIINDIGMIYNEKLPFKQYPKISPIDYTALAGLEVAALGYGLTTGPDDRLKDTLELRKPLQVLQVVMYHCNEADELMYPVMCVARKCNHNATICPGDSGGPHIHESGIVAVTSGGTGACESRGIRFQDYWDLVTPLSPYIDWISSNINYTLTNGHNF